MQNFTSQTILVIVALVVVLGGAGVYLFGNKNGNGTERTVVERRAIEQDIQLTGTVVPAQDVSLSFERGGTLTSVLVSVGDQIEAGQVVAALNSGSLERQLSQARAQLAAEESKLAQSLRGTRAEELELQRQKVENAERARIDARQKVIDSMLSAFTAGDEAVHIHTDQLFDNPEGSQPRLTFSTSEFALAQQLEGDRVGLQSLFVSWREMIRTLGATLSGDTARVLALVYVLAQTDVPDDTPLPVASSRANLVLVKQYLEDVAKALALAVSSSSVSQTTIDGWQTDVATARKNVNTALTSLTTSEQALTTAESNLLVAKRELALLEAGSTSEDIRTQEAVVDAQRALVAQYEHDITTYVIRAPFAGVVTEVAPSPGEAVSASDVIAVVQSNEPFQIDAVVSELDIAGLNEGLFASVTLDAYGAGEQFDAIATHIDPAETLVANVPTYTVTFAFKEPDDRIRSGMTANLSLVRIAREGALAIPVFALKRVDNALAAQVVLTDGTIQAREVTLGVQGTDGYVEVLSGLREGDTILIER